MKTVPCSDRVYYRDLPDEEVQAIKNDLFLYHSMLQPAYHLCCLKFQGIPFSFQHSLEKELKLRYGTNDYFALSAVWEAKGLLKTNVENHRLHKKTLEDQSKAIRRKIDETEKEIQSIDKILCQLIEKTKAGRQTEADYLLEVQELRPRKKQCRNKLSQLTYKLNRTQQQLESLDKGMTFTCFGSKKLARSRTTIYKDDPKAWLNEYRYRRNKTMMIPGRRQGKYSNCLFKYHVEEGILVYRCSSEEREIHLKLQFHHNHKELERAVKLPHNTPGKAVAYVLEDHRDYFIIKAIVELPEKELITEKKQGVIGIDMNVNHIAVSETDACGNCVGLKTIPLSLSRKTTNQRKQEIRRAAKAVVLECVRSNKPLVIEDLDFQKKKGKMRYGNKGYNKMLSVFATKQLEEALTRRCWKEGYSVSKVNPAYTSKIGKEKYSQKMGCTVHLAAAHGIASRGMGLNS